MTPLIRCDTSGTIFLVLYVGIFSWITRFVVATDATCGRPGRTLHTAHQPRGIAFKEGDKIHYNCTNFGDVLFGDSERVCQKDGSWSGDMPVCSEPAVIEEAYVDNEDPKTGTSFSIDGNISTCTSQSVYNHTIWKGTISSFENISAVRIVLEGKRGLNIDVEIKGDNGFHGAKCENGSESIGTSSSDKAKNITFFCPADTAGKYVHINISHVLRICEVFVLRSKASRCLTPDIPGHGNGLRTVHGEISQYMFRCDTGYKLWGNLSTFCKADGSWSPKSPTCERITCYVPDHPNNGRVEYNLVNGKIPYNSSAQYYCNDGFNLEGSSRRTCIQWNTWDLPVPECIVISRMVSSKSLKSSKVSSCGSLPSVANGDLVINATGSTAVLNCNEGYRPLTINRIDCLNTGEWSSQSLSCTIIQCDTNPVVPHGAAILLDNSTYYGSRLKIECNQVDNNSHEAIIRTCEESGTWGDLSVCAEITCGNLLFNETNGGKWISLNNSHSIRILICTEGFNIEGSPPVTQCLPNGTWSYTSAKCRNAFEDNYWGSNLSPSLMLIAAVAVGALTALCILCLAVAFLVIRKRRQSQINARVSRVGDTEQTDRNSVPSFLQMKHLSATGSLDDVIELRPKTVCRNPRKPRSALPNLPLDADPVYAQPYETEVATKKMSVTAISKKDDLYNAHIYAEPVDSRLSSSDSNSIPINVSMCRIGASPRISTIKTSLRNESSTPETNQLNCDKTCAIYDSSGNTSSLSSGKLPLVVDEKHQQNNERASIEIFTDNSHYLEFV